MKRVFQLAVHRRKLDENPLHFIDMPRSPKKKVSTFKHDECRRILKAAAEYRQESNPDTSVKWDLLILTALSTGMRRGELLNCTWRNVDFEDLTIEVWTEDLVSLLVHHQNEQPEGYPYVFVPVARYDHIQRLRQ
ncbi:MAG: tyrosine-type recombinase/integrase, partial [Planctomycetota bacterium]